MIHKLSFSFCRLISHWQNLREIWNWVAENCH
jgi:hypothetical protein